MSDGTAYFLNLVLSFLLCFAGVLNDALIFTVVGGVIFTGLVVYPIYDIFFR